VIWFRSAIPIPNTNPNPNVTVSLTPSQPNAKPDTRAKKYLAVVRNYCTTKNYTPASRTQIHKKANLCIRVPTSDHSFLRYNVI